MRNKGFTLVELIAVVAIISIGMGLFYLTFFTNWRSLEDEDIKRNLWQEMNSVAEAITADCRQANTVLVAPGGASVTLTFPATSGLASITYALSGTNIQKTQGARSLVLSRNVDLAPPAPAVPSLFVGTTNSVRLDLTLISRDNVFGQPLRVISSIFIKPRCSSCI